MKRWPWFDLLDQQQRHPRWQQLHLCRQLLDWLFLITVPRCLDKPQPLALPLASAPALATYGILAMVWVRGVARLRSTAI